MPRRPLSPHPPDHRVIHIQPLAAAKPVLGAPCNGCGVCCLAEPCPLGVLLSRSRAGPCKALRWVEAEHQYRCGALAASWAPLRGLVRRWIAAGSGCDCTLEPVSSRTIGPSASSPTSPSTSQPDNPHD